jgi:uncharacterized membrane protein YphA (DoxX/SURF4 family)
VLRVVIGWHFYTEGVAKIKTGDFTAEPFLRNANGPLADWIQRMIPDRDGRIRLGLVQSQSSTSDPTWDLDPLVTEELWKGFVYRASRQIGFGDPQLIAALQQQRESIEQRIATAESARMPDEFVEDLRRARDETSRSIEAIRNQKDAALGLAERYSDPYRMLLVDNALAILAYFRGGDRDVGFARDGQHRAAVVQGVSSLRSQSDQIQSERQRDARAWLDEVDQMWKGLEADVNALTVPQQGAVYVPIDAPHDSSLSMLTWINRIVPWFDAVVGACLILGLFTRWASLAGAVFLLAIIATQPPFVSGSASTIPQWIELAGLLVLFATRAGRYAGLDIFWTRSAARGAAVAGG